MSEKQIRLEKPNCSKCGTFEEVYKDALCKDCYILYLEQELKKIKECKHTVSFNGKCQNCGIDTTIYFQGDV